MEVSAPLTSNLLPVHSVFTDHGTLLSHTSALSESALLKFPPFAGTVWRNHSSHVAANEGEIDLTAGRIPAMKTVSTEVAPKGKGLRQMTVEMDGVVSVIRVIVPRLLVAAQMESAGVYAEDEGIGFAREERKDDGRGDGEVSDSGSDSLTEGEASEDDDSIAESDSGGESERSEGTGPRANGVSKMRVLELKAEGMAEFLAQEYPARLPNDFF